MAHKPLWNIVLVFCFLRPAMAENRLYDARELFGLDNPVIQEVSADGSTFGGYDNDDTPSAGTSGPAFRWSWTDGLTHVGMPGHAFGQVLSVSPDGSRLVARNWNWSDPSSLPDFKHFQWTEEVGAVPIDVPGRLDLHDATADGSVLVGHDGVGFEERHAIMYRLGENGYQEIDLGLRPDSDALGVSADGRVVVGDDYDNNTMFRWTSETGAISLGTLPGYNASYMDCCPGQRVSADGSTIVGVAVNIDIVGGLPRQAVRWTEETGIVGLGYLPGYTSSFAAAVSADGQVVLGQGNAPENQQTAFVWDPVHKMRRLSDVLATEFALAQELDIWNPLGVARGISADRQTIYGQYVSFSREDEDWVHNSWVVRLDRPLVAFSPSGVPGDLTNDQQVTVRDIDVLMSAIRDGSSEMPYDLNGSGAVEAGDLAHLVHETLGTWHGDANLDGQFGTQDLVVVFQAGQYEDATPNNSTWSTGDWNADGDFTTSDLLAAFQEGGYEAGLRGAVAAVPEPTGGALLRGSVLVGWLLGRRRQNSR